MDPAQADQLMQTAVVHHQAGRLAEAEALYRQVLGGFPAQTDALHLLGLIARRYGRLSESASLIGQAITLNPAHPQYHVGLGITLMHSRSFEMAVMSFRRATELRPDHAEAFANLGSALKELGQLELAADAFQRAIALRSDLAEAHLNLGNVQREEGKLPAAIDSYRKAVQFRPDIVEAQGLLANTLAQNGSLAEATAIYRQALQAAPGNWDLLNNLGNALVAQNQIHEGIAQYRLAVAANPEMVLAHSNLANALRQIGELDEAARHLFQVIALQPDFASAHNNLGNVLKNQGRLDEAIAGMRRSIALDPGSAEMHSNLVYAVCFHPDYDGRKHLEEARLWADRFELPLLNEQQPHLNDRSPDRKLRVGYVSPDFCQHVIGRNVLPIIERHNRNQFEVHCFMTANVEDEMTRRFRAATDRWHDVSLLDDASLAHLIRVQQIDILVDLSLHMAGNRLRMFARKPAPVQVTWAGYPGTTGLRSIDYRITDPHLDPPGQGDDLYSETSVRLPSSFWCYRPVDGSPEVSPLPATAAGFVTFGCLNNFAKVSPAALDLWEDVLLAMPRSRLRLLAPQGRTQAEVRRRFSSKGIESDRLTFIARSTPAGYLKLYDDIDICLDPIPYTGHTTTFDALWMGVPVVTMAGNSAVARGSVTALKNLQLDTLIATSPTQYAQTAAALAQDIPTLASLRAELRHRMRHSPQCNEQQFTADLEAAYRKMWKQTV